MDYHIRFEKTTDDALKAVAKKQERSVAYMIRHLVAYGIANNPLFTEKRQKRAK